MRTRKIIYTDKNGNKHELYYTIVFSKGVCTGGHDYRQIVDAPPTCDEKGRKIYTCRECHKTYTEYEESPGHVWGDWVLNTSTDKDIRKCSVCGSTEERPHQFSYTQLNDKTYSVEAREGVTLEGNIVIPSTYKGKAVTQIDFEGFEGQNEITSVIIPEGVKSIGSMAFYNCDNLVSIVIPKTVNDIETLTINNTSFTTVYYGGTESDWANITIEMGNDKLTRATFYYYSETGDTTGVNTWGYVDGEVFECNGLIFIPIDDDYEVTYNGSSSRVVIPPRYCGKTVSKIYDSAFEGYSRRLEVKLPNTISSIGEKAFRDTMIENIEIPNSVTTFGDECFTESNDLCQIKFDQKESKLTGIPYGCFRYCTLLGTEKKTGSNGITKYDPGSISIPNSVTYIGAFAFSNSGIAGVTFGEESRLERIEECAFFHCFELKSFTIPEGCLYIGSRAFDTCYEMTDVSIPASVIKIENAAFATCDKVKITVAEGNTHYKIENGCLVEIEPAEIAFGNQYSEIPSTASSIGEGAFYGNTYFAPIRIPLNITEIGSLAFGGQPVKVYVEAKSKPKDWADDWCDENVEVVWGYKEDESCSHSYGAWTTTVRPTCTMFGNMKRKCSICGHIDIAPIEPLGHNYEDVITTEPTCLTSGVKTSTCKRCGNVTRSNIPHLGHDWDKGFVRIEPTCNTNGVRRHTCTRCNNIADMGISALRHDWGEWKVVHPVECEIDGMRERKCTRCGEAETEIIKAEGHDWDVEVEVVEPTCTDGGYTIHKCNNCTETYIDTYTDPIGHNIVDGVCTRCHNGKKGIVYDGVSAIPESYDSAFVLGLSHSTPADTHLASISTRPLAGEYIYYCVPTSFGDCAFIYNNFVGGFSLIVEGLTLTDANGKTEAYNIYKSNQANLGVNGAITITIKEMG